MRTNPRRLPDHLQPKCPAATPFTDQAKACSAVRCGIERSELHMPREDTLRLGVVPAMMAFCYSNYAACPSWAAAREYEWAVAGKFDPDKIGDEEAIPGAR